MKKFSEYLVLLSDNRIFINGITLKLTMNISEKYSHIRQDLSSIFENKPKFLLLGIGENRMGDDGAGQYISFYLDKFNKYLRSSLFLRSGSFSLNLSSKTIVSLTEYPMINNKATIN